MEVKKVDSIERFSSVPRLRGFNTGRQAKGPFLAGLRGSLRRMLWVPIAALAGLSFGDFQVFGQATAPIDANSSGVFLNATGAPGMVSSGIGTNSFAWGTGVGSAPSSLTFVGTSLDSVVLDQPFSLGKISYFNGVTLIGTEAYSVDLRTTVDFAGTTQSFDYSFDLAHTLVNTPNTANPIQSADTVLLSGSIPATNFTIDGVEYTVELALDSTKFVVLEGGSASAELIGKVTVVPEPSTVLGGLAAVGLMGAFLLRNSRRNTISAVLG